MNNRPIVGIVAGTMELDAISWHSAGESSLIALTEVSGCNPVIIPALGNNLNFNDIGLVASSPELLVQLRNEKITIRPIAGTRKRGKNTSEDL